MVSRSHQYLLIILAIGVAVTIPTVAYALSPEVLQFANILDYITFENKMKTQLSLPIIPTNYETGKLEPTKQLTTDYTIPIFHENKTDTRIVAFIDGLADKRGQTIIDKDTATQRGWDFDKEDIIR